MMEQGYKNVFWGSLIVLFNINIGFINIMPNFLGYFIIGLGLVKMLDEFDNKGFRVAKKIANLLFVYTLCMSILNIIGFSEMVGYSNEYHYKNIIDIGLSVLVSIFNLLMTFDILSGTINLYLSREQDNQANFLVRSQRTYTVLFILSLILISISFNISNGFYTGFVAVYMIIVQLYFVKIISNQIAYQRL